MLNQSKGNIRPNFISVEPEFFICQQCGNLFIQEKKGHSIVMCCGQPMKKLVSNTTEGLFTEHQPQIIFSGGLSINTATVKIGKIPHPMESGHYIEWVYLYTFQGGQLKFLTAGQKPTVNFALVDDDAYSYCDRSVCQMGNGHCKFYCKRGFAAYAYCSCHGLWKFRF